MNSYTSSGDHLRAIRNSIMPPSPTAGAVKTLDELKTLLKDDRKVKVAGVDVDGVLRGKIMSKDKFLSACKAEGFGFCSVVL